MITKIYRAHNRVDGMDTLWAVNEYGCALLVDTTGNYEWITFEYGDDVSGWPYGGHDYFKMNAIDPVLVREVETTR